MLICLNKITRYCFRQSDSIQNQIQNSSCAYNRHEDGETTNKDSEINGIFRVIFEIRIDRFYINININILKRTNDQQIQSYEDHIMQTGSLHL